jgi:hypothetical protein
MLIVATTHTDMVPDLAPSLYIEKRYREKLRIEAMNDASLEQQVPDEVYKRLLGSL